MKARRQDLFITKWNARYRGQSFPCAIGRTGIGVKMGEGDGITPKGIFRLCLIGARPDRRSVVARVPQKMISPLDYWSDDPSDPDYNSWQRGGRPRVSHERLRRADPLYDMIGVLDFNWPIAVPGAGSAIFLHVWRKPRHPTEGCIAFAHHHLAYIFATWTTDARIVIA